MMCISAEEYKALLSVSTEGLSLAQKTVLSVDDLKDHVESLDKSIRGNGDVTGLNTRVAILEIVTGIEQEHLEEKQAIFVKASKERTETVSKASIDWKWLAIILMQAAIAGLYVAGPK